MHPFCEAEVLVSIRDKMRMTEGRSGMMFKVRYSAYVVNKYNHIFKFNIKQMLNLKKIMKIFQVYFQHLGIQTVAYDQGSDRKFRHYQPS
jgi:hypothetical protein